MHRLEEERRRRAKEARRRREDEAGESGLPREKSRNGTLHRPLDSHP